MLHLFFSSKKNEKTLLFCFLLSLIPLSLFFSLFEKKRAPPPALSFSFCAKSSALHDQARSSSCGRQAAPRRPAAAAAAAGLRRCRRLCQGQRRRRRRRRQPRRCRAGAARDASASLLPLPRIPVRVSSLFATRSADLESHIFAPTQTRSFSLFLFFVSIDKYKLSHQLLFFLLFTRSHANSKRRNRRAPDGPSSEGRGGREGAVLVRLFRFRRSFDQKGCYRSVCRRFRTTTAATTPAPLYIILLFLIPRLSSLLITRETKQNTRQSFSG